MVEKRIKKPLVSAVLTIFNEEVHLSECLQSLLKQSYKNLEIIVVDDGSTDKSVQIAAKFPVKLVGTKHTGLAFVRNEGVKQARGEIVVFCDGDLIYDSKYIEKLVLPIQQKRVTGTFHKDELVANPENFWSQAWQINDGLPKDRKLPKNMPNKSIYFRAVRRSSFLEVGGFDNIGYLDDRTLAAKLKKQAWGVRGAICRHYNPASRNEVIHEAVWHGKSLAKNDYWHSAIRFSMPNTLRRILIDSPKLKGYWRFKLVYDLAINWGMIIYLIKKNVGK